MFFELPLMGVMKMKRSGSLKLSFLFLHFLLMSFGQALAQVDVTVDTTVRYQTILGWGHSGGVLSGTLCATLVLPPNVAKAVNEEMLDYLVEVVGLTGSRTFEVGPRTDGTGNDNGDCDSFDWSKFQSSSLSEAEANYLQYFQNGILSKGWKSSLYSSPGAPTHATDQKPWIVYHPGERAQQIWASALYLKQRYGINIDYSVLYNEPSGAITPEVLADDIKAAGPRLAAQGLATRLQFPEAVDPQTAWNFITPVQNDADMWQWVGRISYHNYGTADPYRAYLRDFGASIGIPIAQTERAGQNFDNLYADLTLANAVYWEVASGANSTLNPDGGLTTFMPAGDCLILRQVLHYVRPGDVRIAATSGDSSIIALAFSHNGAVTVVIENKLSSPQTVKLYGLPAGRYGRSRTFRGGTVSEESGVQTISTGDAITFSINGYSAVTTVYPHPGGNQPPAIMSWSPSPGYLVLPMSYATLNVTASDPENDSISFNWSVTEQPAGAQAVIDKPASPFTHVTGLTEPGTYVFTVSATDGLDTTSRKLYLIVYATNPPAVLSDAGFKIPAPYGLVLTRFPDTTHANIELPTPMITLQCGIADLANSDFSGHGTWSIASQPAGANTVIGLTTFISGNLRSGIPGSFQTFVIVMDAPGDYVFHLEVTNPPYPNLSTQIVCTVHPASSAPVIIAITPAPAVLTLPESSTLLMATDADPDGDLIRHWWVVKTAPAGAKPVFDHQGRAVTNVSGLTVAGSYTFTLRAFDDIHITTKDVTITVNAGPNAVDETPIPKSVLVLYPNPVTDELQVNISGVSENIIRLRLLNTFGQEVMVRMVDAASEYVTLSLSTLPPGMYFVVLQTGTRVMTGKIVKM